MFYVNVLFLNEFSAQKLTRRGDWNEKSDRIGETFEISRTNSHMVQTAIL